jgi:pyrroline-5-carboxylate reductase
MHNFGGPVLLLGAGRMGGALLRGWLAKGIAPSAIAVEEPAPSPELRLLLRQHGIASGIAALKQPPAVVLVAVKPQVAEAALAAIAPRCIQETLVISIAAGRTLASIEGHFASGTPVIRTMPNTPAAIGRGITAAIGNAAAGKAQKDVCEALLGAAGEVVWVENEGQIDAVTAVSGSGPAYVFLLAECLASAGEAQGLAPELAARLARATVAGAGELLHQSAGTPAELREAVTSPAGTTAAALGILMGEPGMRELLTRAVDAAAKRSRELSA